MTSLDFGRYWINAPSKAQPMHAYHGMEVIADASASARGDEYTRVFPRHGPVISFRCAIRALSPGWPSFFRERADAGSTVTSARPGRPTLPRHELSRLSHSPHSFENSLQDACDWGADEQLRLCMEWLELEYPGQLIGRDLQPAMRPSPPSLKQQALEALSRMDQLPTTADAATIRLALEALPDSD
jgi:hypothetical protein